MMMTLRGEHQWETEDSERLQMWILMCHHLNVNHPTWREKKPVKLPVFMTINWKKYNLLVTCLLQFVMHVCFVYFHHFLEKLPSMQLPPKKKLHGSRLSKPNKTL